MLNRFKDDLSTWQGPQPTQTLIFDSRQQFGIGFLMGVGQTQGEMEREVRHLWLCL